MNENACNRPTRWCKGARMSATFLKLCMVFVCSMAAGCTCVGAKECKETCGTAGVAAVEFGDCRCNPIKAVASAAPADSASNSATDVLCTEAMEKFAWALGMCRAEIAECEGRCESIHAGAK